MMIIRKILSYIGLALIDINKCIIDGKYKCNNGSCDLETGVCKCDKDIGYSIDDDCKKIYVLEA